MQVPNHIPQTLPAHDFELTQAQFRILVEGWKQVQEFKPPMIAIKDDILMMTSNYGPAFITANYSDLLQQMKLSMSFIPHAPLIRSMEQTLCVGNIRLFLNTHGGHLIQDGHRHLRVKAGPLPGAIVLPEIVWSGTELVGYNPKVIKIIVGKQAGDVQLAVYDDQIEQLATREMGGYTFTRGMEAQLAKRQPDVVLHSRVAFRYFGDKQTIQLGMMGNDYVLKVTNAFNYRVDLIVMEKLTVLPKS